MSMTLFVAPYMVLASRDVFYQPTFFIGNKKWNLILFISRLVQKFHQEEVK